MNVVNVPEKALVALILVKKGAYSFTEFGELVGGKGDCVIWNIPEEADVDLNEEEGGVAFGIVPWNLKRKDPAGGLILVVSVIVVAVYKCAVGGWDPENVDIILIFDNWANTF